MLKTAAANRGGGFGGPIWVRRAGMGGGLGLIVDRRAGADLRRRSASVPRSQCTQRRRLRASAPGQPYQETAEEAKRSAFVKVVLADTEDTWTAIFQSAGREYQLPTLVLFRNIVESGCGTAQSAAGSVLLPGDQESLPRPFVPATRWHSKLGAGGDFAVRLCDRARNRPPRPNAARHLRPSECASVRASARKKQTPCR